MRDLEVKVKEYIQRYQMFKNGDRVIAGISGGADSVCLFFVLLELQKELGFSFVAVHVNHGLRGADADADEQFVKELCETYRVPLEIFCVDLESIVKKRKQSLEEAGRDIRREAFVQVMEKCEGNWIALAHHQNDNAETLLWNLARGTGLHGLNGIRPVNGPWVRPLLCLTRKEIEVYLLKKKQIYCTDQTNLETTYTRNKLRHQVIPILETEVNSAAVRHMNETMEQMCELREFVEQETRRAFECCVAEVITGSDCESGCLTMKDCENGGTVFGKADRSEVNETEYKISEAEWRKLPGLLQKEVIYFCLEKLSGSRRDLGRVHVDAVAELFDRQVGKMRNLPENIRAVREYEGVVLKRNNSKGMECLPLENTTEIQIPGVTYVPEMNLEITTRILEKSEGFKESEIPQKKYTKWFDYDIMKCLYIRTRQSGDRIAIDSDGHGQKLKSWFVNEKIPANERTQIPLLADGQEIVWIIGYRMSGAYQISGRTKRILQIEIKRTKEK